MLLFCETIMFIQDQAILEYPAIAFRGWFVREYFQLKGEWQMRNWDEVQAEVLELSESIIQQCLKVSPESLGLDRRSAHILYIGDDFIAVSQSQDQTLQYYGGFEYVDKDYRMEVGDLVLYSTYDERVQDHWEQAQD